MQYLWLNYFEILGFYPLLEEFVIDSLFKWGLVLVVAENYIFCYNIIENKLEFKIINQLFLKYSLM